MFMGQAELCRRQGRALIVDLSWDGLLYRGPPGEPNLWNAFFCQPAELQMGRAELGAVLRQGLFSESTSSDAIYGTYRGVVQDYGVIPQWLASHGRELCRSTVALRKGFQARLQAAASALLVGGHRWLAVHIRRTDKGIEATGNLELTEEGMTTRIAAQCRAWGLDAVFLCTDTAALKEKLQARLSASVVSGGAGLVVSSYPSALSAQSGQAVHFDASIDAYQKAEDVMMEALLMARGCHGLLSTFSNVSASCVYLSPEGYPYTTFWEPLGGTPPPGDGPEIGALSCMPPHEATETLHETATPVVPCSADELRHGPALFRSSFGAVAASAA